VTKAIVSNIDSLENPFRKTQITTIILLRLEGNIELENQFGNAKIAG
jgi:hypothetical protein